MPQDFDQADELERRGIALLGNGRAKEAVTAFIQARDIFYKIHQVQPDNTEAEYRLASTLNNIATVYLSANQLDPAQSCFLSALEIFTRLWDKYKDRADFGRDLAATINNLGLILTDRGEAKKAITLFNEAQAVRNQVLKFHPNYYEMISGIAKTNENLNVAKAKMKGTTNEGAISVSNTAMSFGGFCRTHKLGEASSAQNTDPSTLTACSVYERFAVAEVERLSRKLRDDFESNTKIEFGFFSNAAENAFVAQYDEMTYFVAINTGAVAQIANVYADVFARSPDFLTQLRFGSGVRPADRQRAASAVALSAAMHFLIAHQIGHIAYGHLNIMRHRQPAQAKSRLMPWRNSTAKMPALLEERMCVLQGQQEVPPDLCQSMEVDADLYAGSSVVMAVSQQSLCAADLSNVIPDRAHLLRLSTIAILIWFHLSWGRDATPHRFANDASHPLPEVRIFKFLMRAGQMVDFISDKFFDHESFGLLEGFRAVHVPPELPGGFFPLLREQGSRKSQAEGQRVRANEDKYENELGQFALVPVGAVIT